MAGLLFRLLFCLLFTCGVGAINCTIHGDFEEYQEADASSIVRVTILAGSNFSMRCHDDTFAKIIFEKQVSPGDVPCLRNRVVQNFTANHANFSIAYLFEADTGLYQAKAPLSQSSDYDYSVFVNVTHSENFSLPIAFFDEHESKNKSDCTEIRMSPLICESQDDDCFPKHIIPAWSHPILILVLSLLVLGVVVYAVCHLVNAIRKTRERKAENTSESASPGSGNVELGEMHKRNASSQVVTPLLNAS